MQRCCFNCEFFRLEGEADETTVSGSAEGECRFKPPVIVDLTDPRAFGDFPHVYASDWCGQFRKRKSAEEIALDEAKQQMGLC